ncbi:MAG TPA: GNAT family N-acetyltransferase [Gaiellaceae bacterium]
MSGFSFRELTRDDARAIANWHYEEPYSVYNADDPERLLSSEYEYYAAVGDEGELVGYCCFGEDARVAGLEEEPGVLDVGGGLRPDLAGVGLGGPFLREVCRFGTELHDPTRFRVTVAAFNRRAQLVASALGFERTGVHETPEREYVLMTRDA